LPELSEIKSRFMTTYYLILTIFSLIVMLVIGFVIGVRCHARYLHDDIIKVCDLSKKALNLQDENINLMKKQIDLKS
jgi:hypothetical protein